MNALAKLAVSGLGTGYLRPAPGTWGSAGACAVFLATAYLSGGGVLAATVAMACVLLAASAACVAWGGQAEAAFDRKDPPNCTADEWAGQALTLVGLPMGTARQDWLIACGAAFVAFRLMDIIKPPPARQLERVPGGWGILLDDLAAGVYANLLCQGALRWALPALGSA